MKSQKLFDAIIENFRYSRDEIRQIILEYEYEHGRIFAEMLHKLRGLDHIENSHQDLLGKQHTGALDKEAQKEKTAAADD